MNDKRALVLSLLDADEDGRISGRTRLQKLVFLAQKEFDDPLGSEFEFYPYHYGPFSKELLDIVEDLEEKGYISEKQVDLPRGEKYIYDLEEDGEQALEDYIDDNPGSKDIEERAERVESHFNNISVSRLLEYVYNQYESYTEKSVL